MPIILFNTLKKTKTAFTPIKNGEVGMYNCGPTVYAAPHIGNLRAYVFTDLLRRALELNGYKVKQVMNITDVGHLTSQADEGEDKVEKAAQTAGKTAREIADYYTAIFLNDLKLLNIKTPTHLPKATDHIFDQIELIKLLEKKGFTYKIDDGLYFDTAKFPNYDALAGQAAGEKLAGARVEFNPQKRNPADFALWKFSPQKSSRQMEWPSPWGTGFPGWHIECSAMARKYLGQPFDIHTGGVDHIPVHHTNEIAQSEAAFGLPLANFWLHNEFLDLQEKMSKSLGNVISLSQLLAKGLHPLAFRLLCLSAHYRSHLTFSYESLAEAQARLFNYNFFASRVAAAPVAPKGGVSADEIRSLMSSFIQALNDDLNTPVALTVLNEFTKKINKALAKAELSQSAKIAALNFIQLINDAFGLQDENIVNPSLPQEITARLAERTARREAKDFKAADEIRTDLARQGYLLEDLKTETKIIKLPHYDG